jgi:hypothetical protein
VFCLFQASKKTFNQHQKNLENREMARTGNLKLRKLAAYPWIVRRYKNKIVIEITRTRIPARRKPQSTVAPDCKPELW